MFTVNIHHKDIGSLEETGFTHNKNIEPITYLNDKPVSLRVRVCEVLNKIKLHFKGVKKGYFLSWNSFLIKSFN